MGGLFAGTCSGAVPKGKGPPPKKEHTPKEWCSKMAGAGFPKKLTSGRELYFAFQPVLLFPSATGRTFGEFNLHSLGVPRKN